MINVLIADDHQLVRQGLQVLLEGAEDIEIVGQARDGVEAIAFAQALAPDVVLMDINMPYLDGLEATERIRALQLGTHVLIVSAYLEETQLQEARQRGASGYVLKESSGDQLLYAIRQVHAHHSFVGPILS